MASPAGADVSFQYAGLSLFGPSRLERRSKRLQGAVPEGLAVAEAEGQRVGQDDAVATDQGPSQDDAVATLVVGYTDIQDFFTDIHQIYSQIYT